MNHLLSTRTVSRFLVLNCCWLAIVGSQAALIDFEILANQATIPQPQYLSQGLMIFNGQIGVVGTNGWDTAHSVTRIMKPAGLASIDSTTATNIALAHGITPHYEAGVADLVFVLPNTTTPATVANFNLWYGFDNSAGLDEQNRIIIETFDANGVKIGDFLSQQMVGVADQFFSLSTNGIARVRITQVDAVGIDDLFFLSPSAPLTAQIYTAAEICWNSQSGATYRVDWRPSAGPTNWNVLTNGVPGSFPTTCIFDSTRGQSQKLYRVVQQ